MPVNNKFIESFCENGLMHITCKAVSNVLLFRNDENRTYFLKKYAEYSNGYLETYSYILLDNHVHWLVKSVSSESLSKFINNIHVRDRKSHQQKFLKKEISFEEAIEFQFKDFFISYAMAYNKRFDRSGALFLNPFRRVKIENKQHFTQTVVYIHANTVKHGISKDFENYRWSSYRSFLSSKFTMLQREEVFEWFGGREAFIQTHQEMTEYYYDHPFGIE